MRRAVLVCGFLITLFGALSVHVFMLQFLNVPYPANLPSGGWARLPDRALSVLGAIMLYVLLPDDARERPIWFQWAVIFVLLGMIHETLIRLPVMAIVTASRWTVYPFLDALPAYSMLAAIALTIVACGNLLSSPTRRLLAAALIAVAAYIVFAPAMKDLFAGIVAWTSKREGYTLYNPPYDWHVEVPAYITFVEPVVAAFLVSAAVSEQLSRNRSRAFVQLALLLFALRGQFFSAFVNVRYAGTDATTAILSFGQFTLESLALAALTAATWTLAAAGRFGAAKTKKP